MGKTTLTADDARLFLRMMEEPNLQEKLLQLLEEERGQKIVELREYIESLRNKYEGEK